MGGISVGKSFTLGMGGGGEVVLDEPPSFSIRQAFTSVYHFPLNSRDSTFTDALMLSPMATASKSRALSPQSAMQTFRGNWSGVSRMNSCFTQAPFRPWPVCCGSFSISLPVISIVFNYLKRMGRMGKLHPTHTYVVECTLDYSLMMSISSTSKIKRSFGFTGPPGRGLAP